MKYRHIGHYKYELTEDFVIDLKSGINSSSLAPGPQNFFVSFSPYGFMILRKGYAWDGASGPAMDTPSIMRGALVHDGIYQLMREGDYPCPTGRPLTSYSGGCAARMACSGFGLGGFTGLCGSSERKRQVAVTDLIWNLALLALGAFFFYLMLR